MESNNTFSHSVKIPTKQIMVQALDDQPGTVLGTMTTRPIIHVHLKPYTSSSPIPGQHSCHFCEILWCSGLFPRLCGKILLQNITIKNSNLQLRKNRQKKGKQATKTCSTLHTSTHKSTASRKGTVSNG